MRCSVAKSKPLRVESKAAYRNTLYLQGSDRSPKPCKNRKELNIVYTARKAARNGLIVPPDVYSDLSPIEHFPAVRFPQEPPPVQDPLARSRNCRAQPFHGLRSLGLIALSINNYQLNSSNWSIYCEHCVTSADSSPSVGAETFSDLTEWLNSAIWWISTTLKSRGINRLREHRGTILPHLTQ